MVSRSLTERLLIGLFVVEVVVPAVLMSIPEHDRHFEWSMYSRSSTKYRYVGETHDNRLVGLDPAEVGSPWKSVHYGPKTLRLLCEGHAEISSVTRYYGKRVERVERC